MSLIPQASVSPPPGTTHSPCEPPRPSSVSSPWASARSSSSPPVGRVAGPVLPRGLRPHAVVGCEAWQQPRLLQRRHQPARGLDHSGLRRLRHRLDLRRDVPHAGPGSEAAQAPRHAFDPATTGQAGF